MSSSDRATADQSPSIVRTRLGPIEVAQRGAGVPVLVLHGKEGSIRP